MKMPAFDFARPLFPWSDRQPREKSKRQALPFMGPIILSVNSGSSSVKYSLYERTSPTAVSLVANASVSGLTAPPAQFSYSLYDIHTSRETKSSKGAKVDVSNHDEAFAFFLSFL